MVVSTHVRVLVQRARGLRTKGKNGTNNCFVAIELGKEKFVTSVVEKCEYPDWNEEAELSIPTQGNTAALILTVYHQNFMGLKDDFLGEVHLPLSQFDFENPKSRWYKLSGRGGKDDGKPRGDIEVHVSFSSRPLTASLTELHKKKSNSLKHLSSMAHSMGGSLMSLGKEKKSLKKLASSVGHKVSDKLNIKKHIRKSSDSSSIHDNRGQDPGEADPGVISEEDSDYDAPITPTSFTSSSTVPVGQSLESSFEGLNLAPLPIAGLPASKLGYKPSTYYTMGETNPQPTSYIPGDLKYAVLSSGGDRKKPLDGSGKLSFCSLLPDCQTKLVDLNEMVMVVSRPSLDAKVHDLHEGNLHSSNTFQYSSRGSKVHDYVSSEFTPSKAEPKISLLTQTLEKDSSIPKSSGNQSLPFYSSVSAESTSNKVLPSVNQVSLSAENSPVISKPSNDSSSFSNNTLPFDSNPPSLNYKSPLRDNNIPSPNDDIPSSFELPVKTNNKISTKEEPNKSKPKAIKGFLKNNFKFIHNNNKDSLVLSSLTCHDRPGIDKENLETARAKFLSYSREELIQKIAQLEACLSTREQQVVDLECYIDNLLVRVMETSPKLLQCFHVH